MSAEIRKRKSTRYRDIAGRLHKGIRLGRYDVGNLLPTCAARAMPATLARPPQVKASSPALTVVRRYYGAREELFEVTVTTHPEGRYTYTMDMQRLLRPRV